MFALVKILFSLNKFVIPNTFHSSLHWLTIKVMFGMCEEARTIRIIGNVPFGTWPKTTGLYALSAQYEWMRTLF